MVYLSINQFGISYNNYGGNMKLRIKELREDRDIPQKEIANLLNCSQVCYYRYENGQREIPLKSLCILAKFYNTSIDFLVGFTENPNKY